MLNVCVVHDLDAEKIVQFAQVLHLKFAREQHLLLLYYVQTFFADDEFIQYRRVKGVQFTSFCMNRELSDYDIRYPIW